MDTNEHFVSTYGTSVAANAIPVGTNANFVGSNGIPVDTNRTSVATNESSVDANGTFVGEYNLTPQLFLRKFGLPRAGLQAAERRRQSHGHLHKPPTVIRVISGGRLRMHKPHRAAAGDANDSPAPPGEVSNQQLGDAIADTARNPASVGPFTGDFSDPPTQSEMCALHDWTNSFFYASAR
ncbi:MAG: hypothetical protein NT105_18070 [Verrucomicrobia bacterium]|nr:hypothetical protein [Verrucomicrobiota bacterium]